MTLICELEWMRLVWESSVCLYRTSPFETHTCLMPTFFSCFACANSVYVYLVSCSSTKIGLLSPSYPYICVEKRFFFAAFINSFFFCWLQNFAVMVGVLFSAVDWLAKTTSFEAKSTPTIPAIFSMTLFASSFFFMPRTIILSPVLFFGKCLSLLSTAQFHLAFDVVVFSSLPLLVAYFCSLHESISVVR